jgi:hypothetical protein
LKDAHFAPAAKFRSVFLRFFILWMNRAKSSKKAFKRSLPEYFFRFLRVVSYPQSVNKKQLSKPWKIDRMIVIKSKTKYLSCKGETEACDGIFIFRMHKWKKVVLLIIGLLAIISFNLAPAAQAQSQIGIKIVPAVLGGDGPFLVKPGEVLSRELRVTNKSGQELEMYAYLRDFRAADEKGSPELIVPGTESGNYISSWINITSEAIKFAPGEEVAVPFTISVPDNVGPGGYYGAIVFGTQAPKTKPGEAEKGAAVGIAQQATSLILLRVEGETDERADIREFKTDKGVYSAPFEVKFLTKVENLGNVHIQPAGLIEVKNMFGRKVASLMVNDDRNNVLPKSLRSYESVWAENFGFGKYEASLALSYGLSADKGGEGRKSMTMVRYFWVLPMKMVISFLLSLTVTIALFVFMLKMYKKRAIKEAMERMGGGHRASHSRHSPTNSYFSTFFLLLAVTAVVMSIIYFLLF